MINEKIKEQPYNASYLPRNKYYLTLYKAGCPVQARELNDTQLMIQQQIQELSNHLFQNGSLISGGSNSLVKVDYVTIEEDLDLLQFNPETVIVGEVSGCRAIILERVNKTLTDPATLYVKYTATGKDGVTNKFLMGEKIILSDDSRNIVDTATVRCLTCEKANDIPPIGYGQIYYIDEGTIYFEGYYINFDAQHIITSKYNPKPSSIKVGFNAISEIISFIEDSSLLDNSLGYANKSSVGADRLKIDLRLVFYPLDASVGENFILMLNIDKYGAPSYQKNDTEYATIMKEFARRTYETNGNYTIRPYKVNFLFQKQRYPLDPQGAFPDGDDDKMVAVVSPSVSYVMGYRNENISDKYVDFDKARDTNSIDNFIKRFDERSYIIVKMEGNSAFTNTAKTNSFIDDSKISMYSEPSQGVETKGDVVGTFKVSDIAILNAKDKLYKLYIYDISMVEGKTFEHVFGIANLATQFVANAYREDDKSLFMLNNTNKSSLIYNFEKSNIKTLRSISNQKNGSIQIELRKFFRSTLDATGKITFETTTNEFFTNINNYSICYVEVNGSRNTVILDSKNSTMSATSLSLDLGAGMAGATVCLLQSVQRVNQKEKTKALVNANPITNTAPSFDLNNKMKLGFADVYKINSIGLYKISGDKLNFVVDVTDHYKLNRNITDFAYNESDIELIKALPDDYHVDYRLQIDFQYFTHSGNAGYFTIDSYNEVFNDQSNDLTYDNIENYVSSITNVEYPIAQSIDFRPIILTGKDTNAILPSMMSTMIFDIEYYLPRTDLLSINKDGLLYVKKGIPSESPRPPKVDEDAMALYEIWLKPYTYTLKDIKINFIENKRYTMRDIGKLEKRIGNLEYYNLLSMNQRDVVDMTVKDKNGLDRYKNGFLTDDFSNFQASDIKNIEFKASLDTKRAELRSPFKSRNRKLKVDTSKSTNVHFAGGVATMKYVLELGDSQPYSTKSVSINPYMISQRKAKAQLMPNSDTWTDDTKLPDAVVNIDTGVEAMETLVDALEKTGALWGEWETQNQSVVTNSQTSTTGSSLGGRTQTTTTTTTTTIDEHREGIDLTVGSRTDTHTIDDVVKDVQVKQYIRPQIVQFYAGGLIANTKLFAFFDGQPVSKYCRDVGFQVTDGNRQVLKSRMHWGGELISDANGELLGEFNIPEGVFLNGQRDFVLTTNSKFDIEDDSDLSWCIAWGQFYSNGIDVTKQDVVMNVTTPTMTAVTVEEDRRRVDVDVDVVTTFIPPAPRPRGDGGGSGGDPLAQAISYEDDRFIGGVNIYFANVDITAPHIWVQIRTMENGFPTAKVIANKDFYDLTQIPTSTDASRPMKVIFDTPTFLQGGKDYAIVVGGDSPLTRIYMARLNQQLIENPDKILEEQPVMGSSFRSKNGSTWTAEQFEVMKYDVDFCKFDISSPMEMVLNQINEPITLGVNPIETEVGINRVRVHCDDHGFNVNDRTKLDISANYSIELMVDGDNISPQIGQTIRTTTFSGVIKDINHIDGNRYTAKIHNTIGVITAGLSFTCQTMTKTVNNEYVLSARASKKAPTTTIPEITGTVVTDLGVLYPNNRLNGIPLAEFNKEHVIVGVDSVNSFIIETNTPASITGRHGGDSDSIISEFNFKYDVFNVSGAYLTYSQKESWKYEGLMFAREGTKFEGDNNERGKVRSFDIANDIFLDKPNKIMSDINESRVLGNSKSVQITGEFTSTNEYISPVFNIESFSFTTVSNIVASFTEEQMNVSPNANSRWVSELDPVSGTETFKYLTSDVRLANPAQDLLILFDVYKDIDSDFDVYIKYLPMYSEKSLAQVDWIKMDIDKSYHSVDLTNRIEYEIKTDVNLPDWDTKGEEFIAFKVKIVGKATNSAKTPLFKNLRVMAVT